MSQKIHGIQVRILYKRSTIYTFVQYTPHIVTAT